nr:putative baseplate assembly protein [Paenibacillus turpanensis]
MLTVCFGDGINGWIPPEGKARIRIITYKTEFERDRWIGRSSGLPEQVFAVPGKRSFQRESMVLQVSSARQPELWEDWIPVPDLDTSESADRHFVYRAEEGVICFGNNEKGWIPPKAYDGFNIRWISLRRSDGGEGNVTQGAITGFADSSNPLLKDVSVCQTAPAEGGKHAESLQEAKRRARRQLDFPHRAVTASDYEAIARSTPGMRVARVKALPLYKPGQVDDPRVKSPAHMTVVVVPYSEQEHPKAGEGFLETVRRHLERFRLLTTQVHVIPAEYVKVTVHAVVVVEPAFKHIQTGIVQAIRRLLRPMGTTSLRGGWPFGRSVHKGDLFGLISAIQGVVYVQDLWMDDEGKETFKDSSGDLHIPPYSLVYSGDHQIEVIGVDDL